MARFEFVAEDRSDGVTAARWVGDFKDLTAGWARQDLWNTQPRHVAEYLVGVGGVLYPSLLGLVWRIAQDSTRCVVPEWDGLHVATRLGLSSDSVAWEYGIDYEQKEWSLRDRGFVRAESFRRLGPDTKDYERAPVAALVSVSTWSDLVRLVPIGDQSNTTCFFAVRDAAGRERLISAISSPTTRPSLADVLSEPGEVFAVITQDDENSPALDSLMLAGREDLGSRLAVELDALEKRLDTYLAETEDARTQEEWSRAVARLAAVAPVE